MNGADWRVRNSANTDITADLINQNHMGAKGLRSISLCLLFGNLVVGFALLTTTKKSWELSSPLQLVLLNVASLYLRVSPCAVSCPLCLSFALGGLLDKASLRPQLYILKKNKRPVSAGSAESLAHSVACSCPESLFHVSVWKGLLPIASTAEGAFPKSRVS